MLIAEELPVCNISQDADYWLLDSGASHHMSPHQNWFSSYETVDGNCVFMGNNASCQTVGIGNVKIKCMMVQLKPYLMLGMYLI